MKDYLKQKFHIKVDTFIYPQLNTQLEKDRKTVIFPKE